MIRFLAVFFVVGWVGSSTAQAEFDVTIDKFTKTDLGNKYWRIEYSGTFKKLTDVGGGYEKWISASFKIEQTGKTYTVEIKSYAPPSFAADGSFSVFQVIFETANPNWEAFAAAGDTFKKQPKKAFTLP